MPPLYAATLIVLFEIIALGAILPVLATYSGQLGVGLASIGWWTGLLFFLRTSPKIIMNPLWGRCSDRIGRRGTLAIATGGSMAGSVLWACSGNLWWLLASQACVGLFGAQAALVYAIASDVTTREKRAAAMGMLGAAFGVGFTIGPTLGGIVGKHFGYAHVGWLCAGLQGLSLMTTWLMLKETRPDHAPAPSDFYQTQRLRRLAWRPPVWRLMSIVVIATIGLSIMLPTFEELLKRWYHFDAMHRGYAFSVFGLASVLVQGGMIRPLTRRFSEKSLFVAGSIILATGFGCLSSHPGLIGFWLTNVLIGVGAGFCQPTMTAMVSHLVDDSEQGAIHGLNQGANSLGRGFGYLIGGGLLSLLGPAIPYAVAAAIVFLSAIVLLVTVPRQSNPPHHHEASGIESN